MARREALTDWINGRLESLVLDPIDPGPDPRVGVVGVDGSQDSRDAAAWADRIVPRVHLVYAQRQGRAGAGSTPDALEQLASNARAAFKVVDDDLAKAHVSRHVLDEAPAPALARVAEATGADLVVSSPRLHQVSDRPGLGQVAQALAHRAPRPVLFANVRPKSTRLLAALGDERSSRGAAVWTVKLAGRLDMPVRAVHVAPDDVERIDLADFEGEGPHAEAELLEGEPTEALLAEIEETEPGLVVIGHGRNRDWIGSTALALVERSPVAVLVVPYGHAGT